MASQILLGNSTSHLKVALLLWYTQHENVLSACRRTQRRAQNGGRVRCYRQSGPANRLAQFPSIQQETKRKIACLPGSEGFKGGHQKTSHKTPILEEISHKFTGAK